ncbi:hypothetical protein ISN44_As13g007270 [Arabidopsis suecica]|uniref:Uncharacterized protein n=1 Tax=Arabidopsis suecica TaxID=45249 RepID=A0A8T1XQ54_ARASU|nr:hypothetical protein ISN44_As13g007270 [Arabidopsis suecica]
MPILQRRINKTTYGEVLEKVSSRLAGWKSKTLSMAGRITLTKLVLFSISVHSMSSILLPAAMLESLDKLSRSFVWGSTVEKRKQHFLAWGKVCIPKRDGGGLGLKEARVMNKALLAKVGWRLLSDKSSLWAKVLRSKYKVGEVVSYGIGWVLEDGMTIKFWTDRWLLGETLLERGGGAHALYGEFLQAGIGYGGSGESQGQANERGNWVTLFGMAAWFGSTNGDHGVMEKLGRALGGTEHGRGVPGNPGLATAACVIRDSEGHWLGGFAFNIGAGGVESGLGVGGRFSSVKGKRGSSSILPAYPFSLDFGFLSLEDCPDVVYPILLEDVSGTAFPPFLDGGVEEVSTPVVGLAPQPSSVDEPWTAATRERSMVMVLSTNHNKN